MAGKFYVDGALIKTPSIATYSLQDVSDSAAGRTEDAVMHKNRLAQKVKWSFEWWNTNGSETASIMQAFDPEYVTLTYHNPKTNSTEQGVFYTGDRTAQVKTYAIGGLIYTKIAFDVIER